MVPMFVLMTATSFLAAGLSMVPFSGAGAWGLAAGAGVGEGVSWASASPTPRAAQAITLAATTAARRRVPPPFGGMVIGDPAVGPGCATHRAKGSDCNR